VLLEEVDMWMGKKNILEEEIQMLKGQKEELEFILQAHKAVCRLNCEQPRIAAASPVKHEDIEADEYDFILEPPMKRQRPVTLSIIQQSSGLDLETPTNGFPTFESFLTPSTGMTPMAAVGVELVESLNTPIVHSASLNTPGETVNLMSL
jgi:fos-like antigen